MSLIVRTLAALGLVSATSFVGVAQGAEPVRSIGAVVGWAKEGQTFVDLPTAYRWGFGLRGGVTFGHVYVGGAVVHHIGTAQSAYGVGNTYEARYHRTLITPEIGYEASWKYFVLRPYLGFGAIYWYARTTAGTQTVDDSRLMPLLAPGVVAAFRIGPAFLGIDVRSVFAPIDQPRHWAAAAYGTVGVRF